MFGSIFEPIHVFVSHITLPHYASHFLLLNLSPFITFDTGATHHPSDEIGLGIIIQYAIIGTILMVLHYGMQAVCMCV